jgi:hypothetical protein
LLSVHRQRRHHRQLDQEQGLPQQRPARQGRARKHLKGAYVDESSLGKVQSAANADSATTAANATHAGKADTVGGIGPGALTIGRSVLDGCEPGEGFANADGPGVGAIGLDLHARTSWCTATLHQPHAAESNS